jgi:hypothetical protein
MSCQEHSEKCLETCFLVKISSIYSFIRCFVFRFTIKSIVVAFCLSFNALLLLFRYCLDVKMQNVVVFHSFGIFNFIFMLHLKIKKKLKKNKWKNAFVEGQIFLSTHDRDHGIHVIKH